MSVRGPRVAVGLPGNPVSHFVTFHLFVRRILAHMMGRPVPVPAIGRISDPEKILEPGKLETWWPAIWGLRGGECFVEPLPWLHSGHLSALAGANAILKVPPGELPRETASFLPCGEPAILRS
jgi:molybdopterin molybdotransferase